MNSVLRVVSCWMCVLGLACSDLAPSGVELQASELHRPVVDLASALRGDQKNLSPFDRRGFRHADKSDELVHGRFASASTQQEREHACAQDPRVQLGLVSVEACVGADLFFREAFGGNGRTCSSCHSVANNYTIDRPFVSTLAARDPLFVAENDPELTNLEKPELLRDFGLVLVNADGDDPSRGFVMRSVSHMLGLATSIGPAPVVRRGIGRDASTQPPLERTGWAGDGAPGNGTLREFPIGAVKQHMTKSLDRIPGSDFHTLTEAQLMQIERFSKSIGRTNDLDFTALTLSDPAADRGRQSFLSGPAKDCSVCHANAGANSVGFEDLLGINFIGNFNVDVGTENARLPILDELGIPRDGGWGLEPFDSDGDGVNDSFGLGRFNAPPLIEAVDTAPYFHTNAVETLEEAVRFYTTDVFGDSPSGGAFEMTEQDINDVARMLRVLNASLNDQMAAARLDAARRITEAYGNRYISIQRGLLKLADVELEDAQQVLSAVEALNPDAQRAIEHARWAIAAALGATHAGYRSASTAAASFAVQRSERALGQGVHFKIGEGTLMF